MQDTSLMAYMELRKELGFRQLAVLDLIRQWPGSTDAELAQHAGVDCNAVRPRRNELVKLGWVMEYPKRKCMITGRQAITWRAIQ